MVTEIRLIDVQQPRGRKDDALDAVALSRGSTPAPIPGFVARHADG